jgi:hypothetical protein
LHHRRFAVACDVAVILTICGEMRAMKIASHTKQGKRIAWIAGAAVRDLWKAQHDGERPEMRLIAKSNGQGTHEKAVYPLIWRDRIREQIENARAVVGDAAPLNQIELFHGRS